MKETLEEVAENYSQKYSQKVGRKYGFIDGVKWQQEQDKNKYCEDEVLEQLNTLMSLPSSTLDKFTDDNGDITIKWFEQFKKK
jgi:hypothetical protein